MAIEVFDYTAKLLGYMFADFIAFSAPEAIILFGGLAKAKEFLLDKIQKYMDDEVVSFWRGKVKVLPSSLTASDAAILGAASLAWQNGERGTITRRSSSFFVDQFSTHTWLPRRP